MLTETLHGQHEPTMRKRNLYKRFRGFGKRQSKLRSPRQAAAAVEYPAGADPDGCREPAVAKLSLIAAERLPRVLC